MQAKGGNPFQPRAPRSLLTPPAGRAQQPASRKALYLGPLHASALLPRAPSSSRSPPHSLPLKPSPCNLSKPDRPWSRASRPQSPAPPAVTSSCKVRERSRRLQLSGRPGAPALRCGGDARSRPAAEAAWGRPFHPHRVHKCPAGGASSAERSVPWVGVALTHLLDDSLSRGREKDLSVLLALPGLGSARLANFR